MDLVAEIIVVDHTRVWCDGASDIRGGPDYRPAALGHPRIYLQIDEKGYVDCGYCDRRFVLAGGPEDRGLRELVPGHIPESQGAAAVEPGAGMEPAPLDQ